MTGQMSKARALAVNFAAQMVAFMINAGIQLFFTPYLIKVVGAEAFGFVGLSNNLINCAQILTIALNSVAGRYIAIAYHRNEKEKVNRYFTSVLYSNAFLAIFVGVIGFIFALNLENVLSIPSNLVYDFKVLFAFLCANFLLNIIVAVFSVATFITNNLYLSSLSTGISALVRLLLLIVLYGILPPNILYYGIAVFIASILPLVTNIIFTRKLTPEIRFHGRYFSLKDVAELLSSGVWSSLQVLANTLNVGLNLLLTNVFVSSYFMGQLAIAQTIPAFMNNLINPIASLFTPSLTKSYALGEKEKVVKELNFAIKFCAFFLNISLCGLATCGRDFYKIWVPSADIDLINNLTLVIIINILVSAVIAPLFAVPILVNRIRESSLWGLGMSVLNVILTLILLNTTDLGVFAVVLPMRITGIISALTFGLIFPAICLKLSIWAFYPVIIRYIGVSAAMLISYKGIASLIAFRHSLWDLLFTAFILAVAGAMLNWLFLFNKSERTMFADKIVGIFKKLPIDKTKPND